MRIVQLIDSLDAGGAERMAVNYANALSDKIAFSGLVATRKEGLLLEKVKDKSNYLFLHKKSVLDLAAIFKFRKYCKQHQITHIHAHSSSCFLAVLVKITLPTLKIIWHDHYGNSAFLAQRSSYLLSFFSLFFSKIIVVNQLLFDWSLTHLFCKSVLYLPNFPELVSGKKETILKGLPEKRIVCLANLRPQKNIEMLVEVAEQIKKLDAAVTFHVVGKLFEDRYQTQIMDLVAAKQLETTLFFYGSRNDIPFVLQQSTIGVLTSRSEGLPVSVLEYGLSTLPVVATNVGEIKAVIEEGRSGFLVASEDVESFVNKLTYLLQNPEISANFAKRLHQYVAKHFSKETIIHQYLIFLS